MYYSFTDVVGTGSGLSGGDLASKFRDLRNTLEKRGADFDSLKVRLTIFCSNIYVPQVKELSSRLEVDGKVHLDNGGPLGRGTRALCLVAAAGSEPGEDIEVEWSQLFEALFLTVTSFLCDALWWTLHWMRNRANLISSLRLCLQIYGFKVHCLNCSCAIKNDWLCRTAPLKAGCRSWVRDIKHWGYAPTRK